jgi:hypothetical protein
MAEWSRIVRRLLGDPSLDDAERQKRFTDEAAQVLRQRVGDNEAEGYMRAGGLNYSYQGLARYWRNARR